MLVRPPRPRISANGLVAWYPFDETVQVRDSSGNRLNATSTTAVTPVGGIGAPPTRGSFQRGALKFDGSTSQIVLPNITAMSGTTARSLLAWINTTTISAGSRTIYTSGAGAAGGDTWGVYINTITSGNVYCFGNGVDFDAAATVIAANRWMHVAVVYDGGLVDTTNSHIYVNGVAKSVTAAGAASINSTNTNFGIGYDPNNAGRVFSGAIDDLRLYDRALSAGEVLSVYAEAFQPLQDIETIALQIVPTQPAPLTLMGQIWM
jgi:Concanavalin A-like lectin/glucanases superfamily